MQVKDLNIIYEDNHLIAINKPGGLLSQGDETGDKTALDLVKLYIKLKYNKPGDVYLGLVHRLDRPVSGVLLFARTSKALSRLNALFRERKVAKTYLAITSKRPDPMEGQLENLLLKDKNTNKVKVVNKVKGDAKMAVLHYQMISSVKYFHLLKVNPITGRPHQIRVQLANLGCPIIGDTKYGGQKTEQTHSISLHCLSMELEHPVLKTKIKLFAVPPIDEKWLFFESAFDMYKK